MLRKTGVSKKKDIARKEMGRQKGGKCWRRQESARRRMILERTGVSGRRIMLERKVISWKEDDPEEDRCQQE